MQIVAGADDNPLGALWVDQQAAPTCESILHFQTQPTQPPCRAPSPNGGFCKARHRSEPGRAALDLVCSSPGALPDHVLSAALRAVTRRCCDAAKCHPLSMENCGGVRRGSSRVLKFPPTRMHADSWDGFGQTSPKNSERNPLDRESRGPMRLSGGSIVRIAFLNNRQVLWQRYANQRLHLIRHEHRLSTDKHRQGLAPSSELRLGRHRLTRGSANRGSGATRSAGLSS